MSQAIASVMFRQTGDRQELLVWVPLGLFVYTVWHLVKIVTRKPVEPFDWTPAEQEFICAAPISRAQLIGYRFISIVGSACVKSTCFTIVMIPDLTIWLAGLLGMFLGLIFVDLFRVGFELLFYGLSRRGQAIARVCVVGTLLGCVAWVGVHCMTGPRAAEDLASPGALILLQRVFGGLSELMATPIGSILQMPFRPFGEVIFAEQLSLQSIGFTVVSVVLVMVGICFICLLDNWAAVRLSARERDSYLSGLSKGTENRILRAGIVKRVSVPWFMKGFGSLAWRQLMGAYHYRMTLAISLGIPTLLCSLPLFANHPPFFMLLNIVGGIVFYSFLLLPSALMLDFRRDVHRMSVLKSLPIAPVAVAMGQLATPVIICSAFQWTVLLISVVVGSVIWWQAVFAAILLLPVNTLIFAIENFIFLVSPHRRNQEGIDVFLRTILTFTGKGLLFAVALAVTLVWAFISKALAGHLEYSATVAAIIFGLGAWSMTFSAAAGFVYAIVRLFERFDTSLDSPPIS